MSDRDGMLKANLFFDDFYTASATSYCKMTNPTAHGAASSSIVCLRDDPHAVTLVATIAEAELLRAEALEAGGGYQLVSWIDALPFAWKVLYVKSNSTIGFRQNQMQWDQRSRSSQAVALETKAFLKGEPSFKSVARDYPWKTHVELRECPNVGDEALSVLDFTTRGSFVSRFNIFVHGHRESWHAPDLVEQLGCVCLDAARERYRTLTAPTHAFLLQCMSFFVNETEALEAMAANDKFPANEDLVQFRQHQVQDSAAASRKMRQAYRELIGSSEPTAVVRDCCTSFIALDDALAESRQAFNWTRLLHITLSQPSGSFTLDGEVSMYLERFWRHLLRPSQYDFQRDFAQVRCKYKNVFVCPPEVSIGGEADLLPEIRSKPCPSLLHNRFG